jgi:phage-related protein
VGSTESFESALGRASTATSSFGSKLAGLAKTALLVGGAAGVGAVAVGLEKSVKAAIDAQSSTARLDQAFKNVGLSAVASSGQIDQAEASARKLGFADNDVRTSLGSLLTATGDVGKSMSDLAVAQDIARFKGVGLNDATKMLTMAMTGSQRAAKQLGITVIPTTDAVTKLRAGTEDLTTAQGRADLAQAMLNDKMATGQAVIQAVTDKVHGQADAYSQTAAGAMQVFRAEVEHLQVTIGDVLLPTLTAWVTKLSAGVQWTQEFIDKLHEQINAAKTNNATLDKTPDILDRMGKSTDSASQAASKMVEVLRVLDNLWGGLKGLLSTAGNAMDAVAAQVRSLRDENSKLAATYANWGKELGGAVRNAMATMVHAIKTAAVEVYNAAVSVGKSLIDGIVSGVGGLASALGSKLSAGLHGAVGLAKKFAGIFSPSSLTRDEIGVPMAQGIILGFDAGMRGFPKIVSDNLDSAFVEGRKKLAQWLKDVAAVVQNPSLLEMANNWATATSQAAADAASIQAYQDAMAGSRVFPSGMAVATGVVGAGFGGSFAAGGVVPGPSGAPKLILAHGGETITPAGRGGGVTVNVTVNGSLVGSGGMQELASKVQEQLVRFGRNNPTIFGPTVTA